MVIKHILLYGNSIFLNGLASQLQKRVDCEVHQQAPGSGPLHLSNLDAVIVDFDEVGAEDVLGILRACPDVNVVGVNASGGAVTVLSGKVYLARTVADVVACLA
jgi:hypothetical protein